MVQEFPIKFKNATDGPIFADSKPISMITEKDNTAYIFSTWAKDRNKFENVYLTKFVLKADSVDSNLLMIDRVFERGIFGKSKIFHVGPSIFLVSLFE